MIERTMGTRSRSAAEPLVTTVRIDAQDPITAVGTTEALRSFRDLCVVQGPDNGTVADVVLVMADVVDTATVARIRSAHALRERPVVLVATVLDEESVLTAVEAGVRAILRRHDAHPVRLAALIRCARRGEGAVPGDVLGRLLDQVGRFNAELVPMGRHLNGLNDREMQILGLVSEGYETAEIAQRLSYSERTIKGVLHDVTTRLQLRNRTHAVAYALRRGLI